jgi:prepilin signal peptidase PulO-like enzyme (type II secretory pathway)
MTAQITSAQEHRPSRRMAVSVSAIAGIGYAATWIISLSVGAPNPSVAASGSQVVAAFAGRSGPALAMFALAEGAAAIALVAVMTTAARAARRCGQSRAGLTAAAFGIAVAAVSWAELALGTWLIAGLVPDRRSPILPRWLAPLGTLLAAALVTSGLGYLLLTPGLAAAVYVSGVLLLIFVSATGIALRSRDAGGDPAR